MIILGIDPGTAATGYGVIRKEKGKPVLVSFGCIKTESKEEFGKRLNKIFDGVEEIIEKEKPDMIAVEELYFAKNVKTAISIGQARGVILLACSKSGVPIFEYTPLQVKQAVCGYGRGDKKQVQRMVKTLLSLSEIPKPDDAADALAVAICHLSSDSLNKKLTC